MKIKTLGLFLREKRIEKQVSQLEASRVLGHSSPQYISNFERGLCAPSLNATISLAKLYKVPLREIYDVMIDQYKVDLKKQIFGSRK